MTLSTTILGVTLNNASDYRAKTTNSNLSSTVRCIKCTRNTGISHWLSS